MKKQLIFVYGTLMDPEVRENLLRKKVKTIPDSLKGFKLSYIYDGETKYKILEPTNDPYDNIISGEVFEVDENDLKVLDEYETELYKRIQAKLLSGKIAWVYIKNF